MILNQKDKYILAFRFFSYINNKIYLGYGGPRKFIFAILCILLLTSCNLHIEGPPRTYFENTIDITPLLDVPVPSTVTSLGEIIDFSKLENNERIEIELNREQLLEFNYASLTQNNVLDTVDFFIIIQEPRRLEERPELVDENFNICTDEPERIYLSANGEENGVPYQYCIPRIVQQQGGPETLWRTYDSYYASTAVVRRANMFIYISEDSKDDLNSDVVNQAIIDLAEAFQN